MRGNSALEPNLRSSTMFNRMFYFLLAVGLMQVSTCCFSLGHQGNSITFQVIQAQVSFNNASFEKATVLEQNDKTYAIQLKLTTAAADELAHLSSEGIGKTLNIIVNGKIISSATIQSPLGDNFLVTGFTKKEAEKIAKSIEERT